MNQATETAAVLEVSEDEKPIGCCEFCGADVYDASEQVFHDDAECIGGVERFQR